MKIFNKCLRKTINPERLINSLNSNGFTIQKFTLVSKGFARNIGKPTFGDFKKETGEAKTEQTSQAPPKITIEKPEYDSNQFKRKNSFSENNFEGNISDFKQFNNKGSFGDNKGFNREFKPKRFEEGGKREFGERENLRNNQEGDNEFEGKRFERKRYDIERTDSFRSRNENSDNFKDRKFSRPRFEDGNGERQERSPFRTPRFQSDSDRNDFKPRRFENNEGGEREFRPRKFDNSQGREREFKPKRFENNEGGEREFKPRRFENNEGGEREFKPRRFENNEGGEREFKPKRFENNEGGEREFKPKRFENNEGGEREFKPKRFENNEGGEREFRPRRFESDRGDREFRPKRFENSEGVGFKPRRFDSDGGDREFKPRRFDNGRGENEFRPRRYDNDGGDRSFKPRRFEEGNKSFERRDKFQDDNEGGLRGKDRFNRYDDKKKFEKKISKETDDLENDLGADDAELAEIIAKIEAQSVAGKEPTPNTEKISLKLPQKSLKSKISPQDNVSEITKIDDVEGYLENHKQKKPKKIKVEEKKHETETEQIIENENTQEKNANKENLSENIEHTEKEPSENAKKPIFEYKERKYDYIYGIHAVESSLSFNHRKKFDLMVLMNYKENTPDHIQKLINLAKKQNVSVKYLVKEKLEKFTGNRPHNGCVLKSEVRDYISIKSFEYFNSNHIKKEKGNLIVILDQICDPQNFGSILRSAFFIGADHVMVNRIRKPPISASVAKVSSGASECMELFSLRTLKHFISDANKNNWIIINTLIEKENDISMRNEQDLENEEIDQSELNEPLATSENKPKEVKNISLNEIKLNPEQNIILILGSEGFGVSKDITNNFINYNVHIPPALDKSKISKHPYDIIDSLNVGVSAGIIINHIATQLKGQNVQVSSNIEEETFSQNSKQNEAEINQENQQKEEIQINHEEIKI